MFFSFCLSTRNLKIYTLKKMENKKKRLSEEYQQANFR